MIEEHQLGVDCVASTECGSARLVLGHRCRIRRLSITLADRARRACLGRAAVV